MFSICFLNDHDHDHSGPLLGRPKIYLPIEILFLTPKVLLRGKRTNIYIQIY